MKRYVVVWIALLAIVGVEVVLALAHVPTKVLLPSLLVLALAEATLGVMYFMHLRYERRAFVWSVVLAVVITVVLMDHFWFDAFRLLHQRLPTP
ncbi:MAG TPA: cytochrome C oxidase subunit IV family protein [Gemmatimonadales bacterium]|nr:cytochrome C oxidase subunit IV family protein [Gemmatimonadales bacterium]